MCCVMRKPSPDCCTISAFLRERRKRINTEGTEAGARFKAQDKERPQGKANAPVLSIARLHAVLFPATVFLSAFLLFLIEPLFAKLILPRFGGAAAVWAACLVFFQCALLLGYLYADVTSRRLTAHRQAQLHIALLALGLLFLPIAPRLLQLQHAVGDPAATILLVLTVSIGLPFVLLSATSPLVQAWYARSTAQREPYHLFALSNLAS